jgi:YidC/Oxa1 family membrane protein insertase
LADFPNPQQDPGTERRLLLVFVLTFLVILLSQPLIKKYMPQEKPAAKPSETQTTAPPPASPGPVSSAPAAVPKSRAKAVAPAAPAAEQASAESETVIENDLYRITFSNRGAQVKSWILKKFDNEQGKPLELVDEAAAANHGYPLSLWTYDPGLRSKLNSALYVLTSDPPLQDGKSGGVLPAPAKLTFEYADSDVVVRKTFRFDHTYVVHVDTSVQVKGSFIDAYPAWPSGFGDETTVAGYHSTEIEHQHDSDIQRLAIKKISGNATLQGPFDWAGVSDLYFAAVFLPDNPQDARLITLRNALEIPKDPSNPKGETTQVDVLGTAVGIPGAPTSERLFVGPKSLKVLEAVAVPTIQGAHQDLRDLVDFGFFGVIARPLFIWLQWTYKYVHNWGWAIVLQTFIITVALLPLRISQMKSALKMQKAAPQIKAIQEKYKKYTMRDPRKQQMNVEISELYKREGVNPIGGCFPMIIQIPFIWAYYKMLAVAIDLRHAHWLWVHDLSARDPYFLLPIAMVLSMFLIQRITPQAGMDPAQQKMMTVMMPLMMGFLFFNLAAGLNLYYMESNLISVAQQMVMNRTGLGREMREMALKRARKKDKDK